MRNFHWNILGKNFFDLHEKFESMYNDARKKIDEIAERILTLRYQPLSNYSEYMKISDLKESKSDITDVEMVKSLLKDHTLLLNQMRNISRVAEKANDDGTVDLIGAYIRDIEKISWMLDAWRLKTSDTLSKPILKSQLELEKIQK